MITQLTELLENIKLLVIAGMIVAGFTAAAWAAFRVRGGSLIAGISVLVGLVIMLALIASIDFLTTKTEQDIRNGGNPPAEVGGS